MDDRKRRKLTSATETDVLTFSKRRCCVCFCLDNDAAPKTDGQIAHIDGDPKNNALDNLVYLCLKHHDMYDSTTRQSKGITAGELKFYRSKLANYLSQGDPQNIVPLTVILRDRIVLTEMAKKDCTLLTVREGDVIDFVLREAERHPILFACQFSSIPLVYHENVLLISWDSYRATIERLLSRKDAYPLNDVWSSCLSFYRQATSLPYRQRGPSQLAISTEAKRTVAIFKKLLEATEEFIAVIRTQTTDTVQNYSQLQMLFQEAEFALCDNDIGTTTTRLEAILSTIHKLLLKYAPQGPAGTHRKDVEAPKFTKPTEGRPSILIVEDEMCQLDYLERIFLEEGFTVFASASAQDAMAALIETRFDIVMTDMIMHDDLGRLDGREVVIAAKKASPETKVVVLTAYFETSLLAKMECDLVILKPEIPSDIIKKIKALIGLKTNKRDST